MKELKEYNCKTICVVPNDEEYERRLNKRTQEEGVEIPPQAILDMKANFVLPGNCFALPQGKELFSAW